MIIAVQCLICVAPNQICTILIVKQQILCRCIVEPEKLVSVFFCFFILSACSGQGKAAGFSEVKACGCLCLFSFCSGRNAGVECQEL